MHNFFEFEALEGRTLLSAGAVAVMPALHVDAFAVVQPLVTLAKIAGKYTGVVTVTGIHSKAVNVTLKETAAGKLTGTLTSPQDASIKVKITGKVTSTKAFTVTLSSGVHRGGSIAGTGTGTIKGTKLTIKMTFKQGTGSFPGKITLSKV